MSKTVLFYLVEIFVLLPFPLYCICDQLQHPESWIPGMGYLLAVPLLALYVGSFHGLAVRLYPNGWSYYLVPFLLTTLICWLGLAWVDGRNICYKDTCPLALGIAGGIGLLGLIPAWIVRG